MIYLGQEQAEVDINTLLCLYTKILEPQTVEYIHIPIKKCTKMKSSTGSIK